MPECYETNQHEHNTPLHKGMGVKCQSSPLRTSEHIQKRLSYSRCAMISLMQNKWNRIINRYMWKWSFFILGTRAEDNFT